MATCLYKDKPCSICGKTINVGDECEYEPETKSVHHYGCEADQAPSEDSYRLADSLGFRHIPWSEVLRVIEAEKQ